jgi:tetratricopeptide (TPR) repeat protein
VHVFLPGLVVGRYQGEKPPESRVQELTQRIQEIETILSKRQSRDEEDLLERLAIRLRQFGYFDEALSTLHRVLELGPKDPEILREVGFVYRKKGPAFYSQAESYMEQALKLNDADAELHGMLGGLLRRRGAYEQALAHYKVAHQLEPENIYPLVTLGGMCGALGMPKEASEWYQKLETACKQLISQGAADHWTYLCLGEAAVARGDLEAAIAAYQKAVSQNPPVEDVRSAAEQLEFLQERNFAVETARSVLPILQENLITHGRL